MKYVTRTGQALAAICLLGFASLASAAIISFDPTPATGDVGDPIVVDLIWDGSAVPEYLGDYDLDISWDAAIVSLTSYDQDPDFGVDFFGCIVCPSSDGPGSLNLVQVSLDSLADLEFNQFLLGNVFRIATLTFEGLAVGDTPLALSANAIGNGSGLNHVPAVTLADGRICVGPDGCAVAVSEPGTVTLILFGLLALGARRLQKA